MSRVPSRFTPGVVQPEKRRTGPSQADVEAIKVSLSSGISDPFQSHKDNVFLTFPLHPFIKGLIRTTLSISNDYLDWQTVGHYLAIVGSIWSTADISVIRVIVCVHFFKNILQLYSQHEILIHLRRTQLVLWLPLNVLLIICIDSSPDCKDISTVVLSDPSAASDTIDHDSLMSSLENWVGISGIVLSYLPTWMKLSVEFPKDPSSSSPLQHVQASLKFCATIRQSITSMVMTHNCTLDFPQHIKVWCKYSLNKVNRLKQFNVSKCSSAKKRFIWSFSLWTKQASTKNQPPPSVCWFKKLWQKKTEIRCMTT